MIRHNIRKIIEKRKKIHKIKKRTKTKIKIIPPTSF